MLAELHKRSLPGLLYVAPGVDYRIPNYDLDAFMIEVELLLDWYLPFRGKTVDVDGRAEFARLWRTALVPTIKVPQTWVLRDYHSPNILWLPEREGLKRVGILDFQDTLMGPPAYDVASLLQDARVDVPEWNRDQPARPLREGAARCRQDLRGAGLRAALRHAGRATRHEDPRHLRAPRPA